MNNTPNFYRIAIQVSGFEKAVEFYTRLFGVERPQHSGVSSLLRLCSELLTENFTEIYD